MVILISTKRVCNAHQSGVEFVHGQLSPKVNPGLAAVRNNLPTAHHPRQDNDKPNMAAGMSVKRLTKELMELNGTRVRWRPNVIPGSPPDSTFIPQSSPPTGISLLEADNWKVVKI